MYQIDEYHPKTIELHEMDGFCKFKVDGVFHENSENQVLDDEIGLPQFLLKDP